MTAVNTLQINDNKGAVDAKFGVKGIDLLYSIARKQFVKENV